MTLPTQKEILAPCAGVWDGVYVTTSPDGEVLERFQSRQEIRLIEDRWYERITYFRTGQVPRRLDFRASFDEGDSLIFDDESFEGRVSTVREDTILLLYRWKSEPEVWMTEPVTLRLPDLESCLWKRTEADELASVTMIRDHDP